MTTWDDVLVLARTEPALHQFVTLHETGHMTREQALTGAVCWLVLALQSSRAQLLEAVALQPRTYFLPTPTGLTVGRNG